MSGNRVTSLVYTIPMTFCAVLITAGPARAADVHGCPSGDVCLYTTQIDYDRSAPAASIPESPAAPLHVAVMPKAIALAAVVNNTDPFYSSEGTVVLSVDHLVCIYHPDGNDVQYPDTIEDPADGHSVNAVSFGKTLSEVNADIVVDIGMCGGL